MPSGRYQGCRRTTGGSGVTVRIGVFPFLEEFLCFAQQDLVFRCVSRAFNLIQGSDIGQAGKSKVRVGSCASYLLLARIADVLVGFEEGANVNSLSPPH